MSKHTYGYAYILNKASVIILPLGCDHQEINYCERIFYYNVGKPLQRTNS